MDIFSIRPKKQPKVVTRKLGKEQMWGAYEEKSNILEIDERLRGRRQMIIYIHEYFHKIFPNMSEEDIIEKSEYLAHFLWKQHYRKVDLSVK